MLIDEIRIAMIRISIVFDLWLIIPLRYKEWGLFQNTLQTSSKQIPLKPLRGISGLRQ